MREKSRTRGRTGCNQRWCAPGTVLGSAWSCKGALGVSRHLRVCSDLSHCHGASTPKWLNQALSKGQREMVMKVYMAPVVQRLSSEEDWEHWEVKARSGAQAKHLCCRCEQGVCNTPNKFRNSTACRHSQGACGVPHSFGKEKAEA